MGALPVTQGYLSSTVFVGYSTVKRLLITNAMSATQAISSTKMESASLLTLTAQSETAPICAYSAKMATDSNKMVSAQP